MHVVMEASKKAPGKWPYVAAVAKGWQRRFGDRRKFTNTMNFHVIEVEAGSVVEGRGQVWDEDRNNYVGGYWLAVAIAGKGLFSICREQAAQIWSLAADGWKVADGFTVDDGTTVVLASDGSVFDAKNPLPDGDGAGLLFARGDERRLEPEPDERTWADCFGVAPIEGQFPTWKALLVGVNVHEDDQAEVAE